MVDFPTNTSFEIMKSFTDYTCNQFNISELSKKISKSHVTLLPHINKLIEKKVLKEEIRGRNRELSLNNDSINMLKFIEMTENYIALEIVQKNFLIKKINEGIKEINEPVILFGSYAKEDFTQKSDIDIAIIGKKTVKIERIFKYYANIIGKEINLKYISKINDKKDHLIYEILKNHVILNNTSQFVLEVFHEKTEVV